MAETFIEIRGLTKTFHTRDGDLNVLKGIDLSIDKGEIFGIIGFSGAGKSTLARCINRLEMPDSGSIHIGGQDILALKEDQLRHRRRKLGMIFQTFNLWEAKTVYENIAFPLKIAGLKRGELRDRVYSTAELVGLTEKLNAYPGGLSGGQKQRVGIARAIVTEPDVLLSDEATSALDPQTTIQILDLLKEINRRTGITILMITHELDAIKYSCDRMAVLEDGVITEQGTAVPELLELLDIEGTIITADAMSCQKEIVRKIREKGADYVIGLKDNQPKLRQETEEYFTAALEEPQFYNHVEKHVTQEKGHGRIETREYYLCTDPDFLKLHGQWRDLRGVGMMKSRIIQGKTTTEETHYYISSLENVREFSIAARSHWGVENSLHWCLDVTFREDHSRMRKDNTAENFAVVRHIVLNILKRMDDKLSVARRRRRCCYDDDYLQKVLLSIHA